MTAVDRLKADPFAFYAQAILRLRAIDPVDADHTAAWKGSAVHEVFEHWLQQDDCAPDKLRSRAERLLAGEAIHPMLRALWAPRLLEAIDWIAAHGAREPGQRASSAGGGSDRRTPLAGIVVHGRADRIDRLADGGIAVVDYKTGAAADPEGDRRRLPPPARAARSDRPRRRVRGRERRSPRLRILVADPPQGQLRHG